MTDEQDLNIKVTSPPYDYLRRMPIKVQIELTYEQWVQFGVHAEKAGGAINRKIFEVVKPRLDKVKEAMELLTK